MNLLELSALIQSEQSCEDYLRKVGILKTFTECPKCKSIKIGRIRRNKHRCYSCKYEWNIRKGSMLEGTQYEFTKFLGSIKLFELEIPLIKSKDELNFAYETISWIYYQFRICLSGLNQDILKSLLKAIRSNDSFIKYFITSDRDKIRVNISEIKNNQESAYITASRSYNSKRQISYQFNYKHSKNFKENKLKTYDKIDMFWSYANNRISKINLTSGLSLYFYLKELESRYNCRETNFYDILISKIAINPWVADFRDW